jgi:hypothetical protein
MSVVAVAQHGPLRRLVCVPVDMQFALAGAVFVGDTLCVLSTAGRLLQRGPHDSSFHEFSDAETAVGASCVAVAEQLLFVGHGRDVVVMDRAGQVRRSIATALQVDAVAAWPAAVAVCDRSAGAVALFVAESGQTAWTGFTDPAAVALSADAVFVAEETTRRVVRIDRTTGARTIVASNLPFGSPLADYPNGVGPPSLCTTADGALVVGCSGDASLRRLSPQLA